MSKRIKLTQQEIAYNKKLYDEYHKNYHMDDGWDTGNKESNFEDMAEIAVHTGVPISGTKCLDVGCGTGDLSLFLRKRGAKEYLGVDIYAPSIKKAQKKYPTETFLLADFLAAPIRKKFDYAFCSGGMTVKLPDTDNYEFLKATLKKMWRLTKIGIVFNILTDDDDDPDEDLFFYSADEVKKICREIIGKEAKIIMEKSPGIFQMHFYLYRDTLQIA